MKLNLFKTTKCTYCNNGVTYSDSVGIYPCPHCNGRGKVFIYEELFKKIFIVLCIVIPLLIMHFNR